MSNENLIKNIINNEKDSLINSNNNEIFIINTKKMSKEISKDLIEYSKAYGWFEIEQGDVDCAIEGYLRELRKELYKQITKNLKKNNKIIEELIA